MKKKKNQKDDKERNWEKKKTNKQSTNKRDEHTINIEIYEERKYRKIT